jgi:single-strand DNA-binding protein
MYNKIILLGNLTRDPEVRYAPSGTPVSTIRLAVTTKQRQGDDTKDDTLFIDAVVFGRQAEICGQYLSKGSPVLVEGRLRERKWESEGTQKSKFEVIANAVRLLPKREGRQPQGDTTAYHEAPPDETTDMEPF